MCSRCSSDFFFFYYALIAINIHVHCKCEMMDIYYSLGSFFLSSCISHIAKLSSAKEDD